MDKFVIIDGNSLINRAFYGLPPLKSLSGKSCNAIFGFINAMLSIVSNENPKYLVCVFDAGKHTFRHDLYAEYKGTRDKMPEDLHQQLDDLKQLLMAMGVLVLEKSEIEADDIIGSLTRKFEGEFLLLSGDKDLLQLINKNTSVMLTQHGLSKTLKVDEDVLLKEFGLKPYQVIELKSIMGDSSDNIPGVAGIGKVGATKLIQEYDTLENVYANLDKHAKSIQTKLLESREMAFLSKQLATIKLDVDLQVGLEDCLLKLPFNNQCIPIMQDLNFKSLLSKNEFFTVVEQTKSSEVIKVETAQVETEIELENMINELGDSFSVDIKDMFIIFASREKEYELCFGGELFNANIDKFKELFSSNKQKIFFDAKKAMSELSFYNIDVENYFDVSIAIYIANELDAEISLTDALKLNNIETEQTTAALFKLKEIYISKLINSTQLKLYTDIELPLVKVLFQMEKSGVSIDVNQIKSLSEKYHNEMDIVIKKVYELAGEEFNINSPKQLQTILFDKLKIEYKGKPSTSIEVLNAIESKHQIVPYIIRYRKIAKLVSTYLDGMLNYVGEDKKIHTTFMQRTTSTGRLSSREPNLQNLPIRDEEGRELRKMFSSSFEGGSIISADYNQIELRLMANFSKDDNMVADYLNGKDIHTATASKIFGVEIGEVTSQMRRVAKSVNFGIIYGISSYGLSQGIGVSVKEAGEFIKKYMEIYPKVKEYGEQNIAFAKENGYSKTLMGRIRHIADINSANHMVRGFAERVAKNMPLQGSASDIIKIAMIKVFEAMNEKKLKSKLVLQIHDELVVDCYPGESDIVKQILKQVMESVVDLTVPLIVEVNEGKTLFDAK